jgi:hypothetical protein
MKPEFTRVQAPEPAMPWAEYKQIVEREWTGVLMPNGPVEERVLQAFLEKHPCMLPIVGGGHHGLFPSAVVSQPMLPGLEQSIPDFLMITRNSDTIYAQFIEIEAPHKPWATKSGQPSRHLKQAIDQIKTWKSWFSIAENVLQFQRAYRLPGHGGRTLVPRYVLIYGRRSDPSLTEEFSRKRYHLQADDEVFMTYDRLCANEMHSDALTVKLDRRGYRAVSIPPTVRLNFLDADHWAMIRDKEKAIKQMQYISAARRAFLLERWPYWDAWVKLPGTGMRSLGYCE